MLTRRTSLSLEILALGVQLPDYGDLFLIPKYVFQLHESSRASDRTKRAFDSVIPDYGYLSSSTCRRYSMLPDSLKYRWGVGDLEVSRYVFP